eukprot:4881225-Pleurochrysis_carterae.AAC.2
MSHAQMTSSELAIFVAFDLNGTVFPNEIGDTIRSGFNVDSRSILPFCGMVSREEFCRSRYGLPAQAAFTPTTSEIQFGEMQSMSARLMKAALMMAALPAATAMAGAMARISRTTPLVQSPRCASPVAVGELVQAAAEMPDYSNAVLPVVAGASALFAGAGLAFRNGAADSATNDASEVVHDVVEEVKEVAEAVIEEWPSVGGGSGIHRGAGRYPAPPPRELWTPPPGWTPPRKPVISWYDRGIRLQPEVKTAAAPTATAAKEESKPSPQSFFGADLSLELLPVQRSDQAWLSRGYLCISSRTRVCTHTCAHTLAHTCAYTSAPAWKQYARKDVHDHWQPDKRNAEPFPATPLW